jgi:hypothetical protein
MLNLLKNEWNTSDLDVLAAVPKKLDGFSRRAF